MDYSEFKREIYSLINFDLDGYKERQMKRRIETLMHKNGIASFDAYFAALKAEPLICDEFIKVVTINVTEFFRNIERWDVLEKMILPEILEMTDRPVIWCSACSTGEEPCSLVMILKEHLAHNRIRVIASDFDDEALAKAKAGIYSKKSIEKVPAKYRKYFEVGKDVCKVKKEITDCIRYEKRDLLHDSYPTNCHLILCRNVLIYFTSKAKKEIYDKILASLISGGVLFIGNTEQILTYEELGFQAIHSFFYRKVRDRETCAKIRNTTKITLKRGHGDEAYQNN
jgi:chemotaxis protein methyltransferase CheR